MFIQSDNNTVKTISMMVVNGLYSVLGANCRVLCTKYNMVKTNNEGGGIKHMQMRKTYY